MLLGDGETDDLLAFALVVRMSMEVTMRKQHLIPRRF